MLLPYTTLTYYGAGATAMSLDDGIGVGSLLEATPHQTQRFAISVVGTGDAPILRPYRGYGAKLDVSGYSFMQVTPHQRMKVGMKVSVGATPSADDIAQAVWNSLASRFNYPDTMGSKLNTESTSSGSLTQDQSDKLDTIAGLTGLIPALL